MINIASKEDISKISDLEKVVKTLSPRHFIIGHLVNCDWTIHPDNLKKVLISHNLNPVTIFDKVGSHLVI